MEHSTNFNKVKDYYDRGLWDKNRVANAVLKGWITADEYEEIVGEVYTGETPSNNSGDYSALKEENKDMKEALNLLGVTGEEVEE